MPGPGRPVEVTVEVTTTTQVKGGGFLHSSSRAPAEGEGIAVLLADETVLLAPEHAVLLEPPGVRNMTEEVWQAMMSPPLSVKVNG